MVQWMYCRNCGTIVDEFEKVCSSCMREYEWDKKKNNTTEKRLTVWQNLALTAILFLAGVGAATTVYAVVELIALR
tara:strand:+ start:699 stop:926 length:228 start_codon:yes stop_codon:yes gene_type:complete